MELPSQRHRATSRAGARRPRPVRVTAQERWVYETIQRYTKAARYGGLTDAEMWNLAPRNLYDQVSSMKRARIMLVHTSKQMGTSPYHPIEASGQTRLNRASGCENIIWHMKPRYLQMPYQTWVAQYKQLAHEH